MTISPLNSSLSLMQPGDLLAFDCKAGMISRCIKVITRSRVSHVAMIYQAGPDPVLIESTTLDRDGRQGVCLRSVSRKIADYDGDVWWLPMLHESRFCFDQAGFNATAGKLIGEKYDTRSVLRVLWRMLPVLRRLPWLKRDGNAKGEFCSELATRLLIGARVLTPDQCGEPSDVTPVECCELCVFGEPVLMRGDPLR